MKDHLRQYFPERFEDSDTFKLANKITSLLNTRYDDPRHRKRCEQLAGEVFSKSNELKLLAGAMKKYGCNFKLTRHVACEKCYGCSAGFDPDTNQIILCHNKWQSKDMIMAAMMHEMIHMFDYCRAKFDFNNLEHVACSEIRAANLTYCSLTDKLRFGPIGLFDIKKTHRLCVKDVAYRSVKAYSPETDDETIWNVIDRIFPGCYNDLEPFGRRPNGSQDLKQSYRERYYHGYI